MTFLKKVREDWTPVEFPAVQVGEVVDFPGPYEALVRSGTALLVDKDGNELELPGQIFECPVCFGKVSGLKEFTEHVSQHMPKVQSTTEESSKKEITEEKKTADIRAKRLAALEKARAARLANLKK
jgi:hypothetical protein